MEGGGLIPFQTHLLVPVLKCHDSYLSEGSRQLEQMLLLLQVDTPQRSVIYKTNCVQVYVFALQLVSWWSSSVSDIQADTCSVLAD